MNLQSKAPRLPRDIVYAPQQVVDVVSEPDHGLSMKKDSKISKRANSQGQATVPRELNHTQYKSWPQHLSTPFIGVGGRGRVKATPQCLCTYADADAA